MNPYRRTSKPVQPKIYHASIHDIDNTLIDSDALYVIRKLRDAGFTAYLVGGGVRDLLTKQTPKDFDISTSAKPEEIKKVFQKNCLLIGRRFRLAHVRFGHKIIEVATFRSGENDSDLIVHDNLWGTEEEDVTRRDFTINGLLYDPETHNIIDYVGGWEDIHKGLLRTIGDPIKRFKQDPVRMLRLLKFRARFGFNLDPEARKALFTCKDEIAKSSSARILEEIFRMLESGAAAPFFSLLTEVGFLDILFPQLACAFKKENKKEIFMLLSAADKINKKKGRYTVDRAVLTACLLYPLLEEYLIENFTKNGQAPHLGDVILATGTIIKENLSSAFHHFPRRITASTNFILVTQYRLTPLSGKRHHRPKILQHKEFGLALELLKLRAMVNQPLTEIYYNWKASARPQDKHHGEHRHRSFARR